jgi:hypothetical protein
MDATVSMIVLNSALIRSTNHSKVLLESKLKISITASFSAKPVVRCVQRMLSPFPRREIFLASSRLNEEGEVIFSGA